MTSGAWMLMALAPAFGGPIAVVPDHDLFRTEEGTAPFFRMTDQRPADGPPWLDLDDHAGIAAFILAWIRA